MLLNTGVSRSVAFGLGKSEGITRWDTALSEFMSPFSLKASKAVIGEGIPPT